MSKLFIVLCFIFLAIASTKNVKIKKNFKKLAVDPTPTSGASEQQIEQETQQESGTETKTNGDESNDNALVEEKMTVEETLLKIQSEKAEVQKMLTEMKSNMEAMKEQVTQDVLSSIRWNGLYLGYRWRIAEEGSSSYQALVFRDMLNTNAGNDKRYAMYKNTYRDL